MAGVVALGDFSIAGRPSRPGERLRADVPAISPEYFRVMSVPVLEGRVFTRSDDESAPAVAVINQNLARRFFSGEDPLGKQLAIPGLGPPKVWQIVGVVGDVRLRASDTTARPMIYLPYLQSPRWGLSLVIHSRDDAAKLAAAVRSQVWTVDKDLLVERVRTMEQVLSESVALPRLETILMGAFAALALGLAMLGIYAIMSYSVRQRTREFAVRMALGARPGDILKITLRQGLLLTTAGLAAGLGGAFAATRLLRSLLYGVTATDPLTFVIVPLVLAGVALAACYLPARRATKVDPLIALRSE
jgi:putative ABC transport system permease protein